MNTENDNDVSHINNTEDESIDDDKGIVKVYANNQFEYKMGKMKNGKLYPWIAYNTFSGNGEDVPISDTRDYEDDQQYVLHASEWIGTIEENKWALMFTIGDDEEFKETFIEGSNQKHMDRLHRLGKKRHYFIGDALCVYVDNKKVLVCCKPYTRVESGEWMSILVV